MLSGLYPHTTGQIGLANGGFVLAPEMVGQNLQVWIGAIDTDDRWDREDPATGEPLDGDLGTVPYFGGGSQRLWGRLGQIGYEGGGLVSWKNDSNDASASPSI